MTGKRGEEADLGVIYCRQDYAGFLKRIVIALVDMGVLVLCLAGSLFATDYLLDDGEAYFNFNFLFFLISSVLYLAVLKRTKFGTLGYIITGVKIVDLKGERPSMVKMVLRTFLLAVGPFETFIDIIWLTSEKTRQTLRDKYVGTYVVQKNAVPVGTGRLQSVSLGVMGWYLMYREVNERLIK